MLYHDLSSGRHDEKSEHHCFCYYHHKPQRERHEDLGKPSDTKSLRKELLEKFILDGCGALKVSEVEGNFRELRIKLVILQQNLF